MINSNSHRRIVELPEKNLLLLGLCYAERSRRIVAEFDEFYNEGLSKHFINKLDKAFDYLLNASSISDSDVIKEYSKQLEQILPDSEDFPEIQGGLALDGLSMLCYCYRYILTKQLENISYILDLALEITDATCSVTTGKCSFKAEREKELVLLDEYISIINAQRVIDENAVVLLREMNLKNAFTIPVAACK